jgi:hypothetical protein
MEIREEERPDVLLPKKSNAVFNHPMGFPVYDGLAMDMHAMKFAEALLKDNNELRAALVERVPLSEDLIGAFYLGVAGGQPTLLTRKLFTAILKATEIAHNIKEKAK